MKKTYSLVIVILVLFSTQSFAQLEIGASYELRDQDPQSGFGVRVQKGFLNQVPLINISMRAHFSFFSDENNVDDEGINYDQKLKNYDFGVAITSGIPVGLIEPYIGLGLGSTTLDIKKDNYTVFLPDDEEPMDVNESNIYWNGFLGAKVSIIPLVKPFVEYRYSDSSLSKPENIEVITGRIIFGVSLSF